MVQLNHNELTTSDISICSNVGAAYRSLEDDVYIISYNG